MRGYSSLPTISIDGKRLKAEETEREGPSVRIQVDETPVQVEVLQELSRDPLTLLTKVKGRLLQVTVMRGHEPEHYQVWLNGRPLEVFLEHAETALELPQRAGLPEGPVLVSAPMAGRIVSLKASLGMTAEEGQALVVLEAMKMENEIAAPRKGVVREVYVQPGALVSAGDRLVLIA